MVEKIVSPHAIRLALPRNWRIHNVFHVSLLEPYRGSALRESPDAEQILRDTDDIEYSEEYDVDEVMAATQRTKKSRVMYLVKWLDYPARKDWTQEPYESFSVGGWEKLVIFTPSFPTRRGTRGSSCLRDFIPQRVFALRYRHAVRVGCREEDYIQIR